MHNQFGFSKNGGNDCTLLYSQSPSLQGYCRNDLLAASASKQFLTLPSPNATTVYLQKYFARDVVEDIPENIY
jgi:hypothetical protein